MSSYHGVPQTRRATQRLMNCRFARLAWLIIFLVAVSAGADATVYRVGPGEAYPEIDNVPWESLNPGDIVEIAWRANPYLSKWVIARAGTHAQPIIVRGIAGTNGQRPVISGDGAITRTQLNFWNEDRGVIKIGGASVPSGPGRHIVIESLEIRGAYAAYSFTDDNGNVDTYRDNAAAIFIEHGENINIRDCVLTDSGNGLFVANQSTNITLEHSYVFGNGNVGSIFEHNTYTEAFGMTYQFNRFGPLRSGAGGNNLKDRSAGLIVRYNWVEDGNRQLDLVDSAKFAVEQPGAYQTTLVYGNILIEHDDQGNRQMVHYGGDSGNSSQYRKGALYFYHNTLISERTGRSTLFRLATNDETADVRNNIFFNAGGPNTLELASTAGIYDFTNNWISQDYVTSFDGGFSGTVNHQQTFSGDDPGFIDRINQDYRLNDGSAALDAAAELVPAIGTSFPIQQEYALHQQSRIRGQNGSPDLGAFEAAGQAVSPRQVPVLPVLGIAVLAFTLVSLAKSHARQF